MFEKENLRWQSGGFADLLFITDEIVENALQMGRSAKDVARSILQ